jgi:hypothetical protein
VTLPFIESERFTIDWVYNILDHKKESERIIYEDPDPESGKNRDQFKVTQTNSGGQTRVKSPPTITKKFICYNSIISISVFRSNFDENVSKSANDFNPKYAFETF